MKNPHGKGYYSSGLGDWVKENYTTWTIKEWEGKYGGNVQQVDAKHVIDREGRHWEFFGFLIPLYEDGEKT